MSAPKAPESILILGAGVFGLSTAHALALSPKYSNTKITLVSHTFPTPLSTQHNSVSSKDAVTNSGINDPATARMASIDNSRIIRPDYAHEQYASLAAQAQELWRHGEVGRDGRYSESGLILVDSGGEKSYARKSLKNVLEQAQHSELHIEAEALETDEAFKTALRNGEDARLDGQFAYVNSTSGWADAGAAMRWLQSKAHETGRVEFVQGEVEKLLIDKDKVIGAALKSSTKQDGVNDEESRDSSNEIKADFVVLATGAWTPTLLDMSGVAEAHIQCTLYLSLTEPEAEKLQNARVSLNLDSGCFYFPPSFGVDEQGRKHWSIKLARHAHGYLNPVSIKRPPGNLKVDRLNKAITTSLPPTDLSIPERDVRVLLEFAANQLPSLNLPNLDSNNTPNNLTHEPNDDLNERTTEKERTGEKQTQNEKRNPKKVQINLCAIQNQRTLKSRHCTYLDTADGNFVISYHPILKHLFIATGGSGHGFKFLPVIGDKIVGVLEGREDEWASLWRWPTSSSIQSTAGNKTVASTVGGTTIGTQGRSDTDADVDNDGKSSDIQGTQWRGDGIWCEDGSRAGTQGEVLGDFT